MFPGFNRAKRGTISNGDWDRDGVRNRKDCEPLNFRKQGPSHKKRKFNTDDYVDEYTEIGTDRGWQNKDGKWVSDAKRKEAQDMAMTKFDFD